MKAKLFRYIAAASTICAAVCCSMSANAATVDDVASVARSLGVSESVIQQAYNQYNQNPGKYSSEDLDNAIVSLYSYQDDLDSMILKYFGVQPQKPATTTQTTQPAANNNSSVTTTAQTNNSSSAASSDSGSTSKSSQSDFINMSMDEKIKYVNSLSDSEKTQFINNLSTEEKNSILKQLSTDEKINILDNFIQAGKSMGMNFQIDEVNDDKVAMSVRNADGTLVDVSAVGSTVEDTGYDYHKLFALAGSALFISTGGIYLLYRKLRDDKSSEDNNG